MSSYDIEFDKVFKFDLTGKVQFGDMPTEMVNVLFQDGRVASKFLEHTLPTWFPELKFMDQDGYDHIDEKTGAKYDLKGFTKGGAKFAPSNMIGAGRKVDKQILKEHACEIDYVFSDITEFPKVQIVFKKGSDLVEKYPNGAIPKAHRNALFG